MVYAVVIKSTFLTIKITKYVLYKVIDQHRFCVALVNFLLRTNQRYKFLFLCDFQELLIQDIQNGDREQALALLEKFSPLLKKYAFFLQSEDALQDFQCFLLAFAKNLQLNELTISTDGAIISYINKAIYHHYIALSKAKRHQLPTVSIESQTDYDPLQFDTAFSESDTYNNLLLLDLKRALSTEEYHVIYDHYFRQYSIQEIATRDNKSRQAINKCKKTAIIKLRRYFGVTS